MNHTPLINSKRTMILAAIAVSCPFAQASTAGYISTSSAAGTSQVGPTAVYSGDSQDSINAREAARRKAKTSEALELLQQGRTCYSQKEYVQALEKYEAAWKVLPKAPATQKLQEFLVKSIGDASIAVAMEYSRIGRYDEAEQLLLDVLEREPNNKRARHELSLMRDPVRTNPALTPEHVKNVEEVNRLLTLAYGHYDLGNYDAAYAEFNRVIKIDPYNVAARRGQEAVSKRRSTYYRAAYDSYRAKALAEVDALWEEQLPQELPNIELGGTETVATSEGVLRNRDNLVTLKIASVNFEDTPMSDALDFLRAEARKSGQQMNFIFEKAQAPAAPVAAPASSDDEEEDDEESEDEEEEEEAAAPAAVYTPPPPAIISSLQMNDVTAADLLAHMCSQAGCEYRVEENAVVVYQKGAASHRMSRRQWTVRPSFFNGSEEGSDDEEEDSDFSSGSSRRTRKIDAKASLIDMGVNFPQGATAKYSPVTGVLTVTNTDDELDTVEEAINKFRQDMPKMVKVSAKFVEITQTNEEELSFDWVINPFSISDSGRTYLGGVNGAHSNPNRLVSDFVSSGGSAFSNNYGGNSSWPISSSKAYASASDTITNGLMTGGLRSGSGAITSGALQNLMTSGSAGASATASAAPGVMSLSGIYDSGSYQMIMRGLSQKKGVDVMSAPSLVISGDEPMDYAPAPDQLASDQNDETGCAKIEVIRRFVYPTEYDEPQIESSGNNNNNNDDDNGYSGSMPVAAPANPSSWGVEEVGVMLRFQIEPLKEGDGDIVRFKRFEIRVVDFEGFVNYGSPITAGIANQNTIEHITLTDNRIDMPIFSRRYINSNPCVYDGHTIAIGGMIQDEVQKVEDKVPVFGDLPLIGRLFRSNAESHVRKNLMVFVTADVIDPFGKPMRKRDTGTSAGGSGSSIPGLFPDDGLVNP